MLEALQGYTLCGASVLDFTFLIKKMACLLGCQLVVHFSLLFHLVWDFVFRQSLCNQFCRGFLKQQKLKTWQFLYKERFVDNALNGGLGAIYGDQTVKAFYIAAPWTILARLMLILTLKKSVVLLPCRCSFSTMGGSLSKLFT